MVIERGHQRYVLYVDMDDVLCEYSKAHKRYKEEHPEVDYPQSKEGFFRNLEPIKGAVEAVNRLREIPDLDVYILTAPSHKNPLCYTEKRQWIENYFDLEFTRKLVITTNKGLLKGDYLVDDYLEGKGQESFTGELIQFASERFPSWKEVILYLLNKIPN